MRFPDGAVDRPSAAPMMDRLRSRLGGVACLTIAAMLVVACGGAATTSPTDALGPTEAPTGAPAAGETVVLADIAFQTQSITVPAGTSVTWDNQDVAPHTATHGMNGQAAADAAFDLDLPTGQQASYTFDEAGTFPVTCRIHPQMQMTVTVE